MAAVAPAHITVTLDDIALTVTPAEFAVIEHALYTLAPFQATPNQREAYWGLINKLHWQSGRFAAADRPVTLVPFVEHPVMPDATGMR